MTEITKKATRIVFGNKEKKQFPDPEGLEREKPSSAIEGSTQPLGSETNRSRNKFSEAASPMPGARQTLNNRLQRVGSVRRGVTLAAPRKEEVDGNMENKTFTQFVTEAKRGRPRKLKPGEKVDTEHLQDQLSKLTHANHVMVHFKNGEKHEIPRAHANKALIHLSGLKPIHRADHVEHMHSSKENFYHTLASKSIPSKKKTITLAGPKLRKEEVEQIDEASLPKAPGTLKGIMALGDKERKRRAEMHDRESARLDKIYAKHYRAGTHGTKVAQQTQSYSVKHSDLADRYRNPEDHFENQRRRRAEFADGVSVKEEVETDEKKKKDHHKLLQKFRHRIDEIKAIKGTHATKLHAAKVIHPDKVGYAGKQTKPKVQNLRKEEIELYDSLSDVNKAIFEKMDKSERDKMIAAYYAKGGKITRGKYNKPRESEKPFPASKMKGSKWASTADSINRKNQGYRK